MLTSLMQALCKPKFVFNYKNESDLIVLLEGKRLASKDIVDKINLDNRPPLQFKSNGYTVVNAFLDA